MALCIIRRRSLCIWIEFSALKVIMVMPYERELLISDLNPMNSNVQYIKYGTCIYMYIKPFSSWIHSFQLCGLHFFMNKTHLVQT